MVTRRCREESLEEIKDGRFGLIWVLTVVRPEHTVDGKTGRWAGGGGARCEVRGVKRGQEFENGATAVVDLLVISDCEMSIVGNIRKFAEWRKRRVNVLAGGPTSRQTSKISDTPHSHLCTFHLALGTLQTGCTHLCPRQYLARCSHSFTVQPSSTKNLLLNRPWLRPNNRDILPSPISFKFPVSTAWHARLSHLFCHSNLKLVLSATLDSKHVGSIKLSPCIGALSPHTHILTLLHPFAHGSPQHL